MRALIPSLALAALSLATPALAAAELKGIDVKPSAERIDVVVNASEPLTFQSWARSTPPVLVVDLLDTAATEQKLTPGGPIEEIAVTRHDARNTKLSRLSLKLAKAVDYDVTARGNDITISLFLTGRKPEAAPFVQAKPVALALNTARGTQTDAIVEGSIGRATADETVEIAQGEGPRQMTYIGFKNTANASKIYARMNAEAQFNVRKEGSNLVVLTIQNATIPLRNNKNHLDTTFFTSPVKMITPSEVEDATPTIRITIEMKEAAPYEAKLEGREVTITFKK